MSIAIYGPMCSGKTTVANIIKGEHDNFQIYSFGGRIKELASELFNMQKKNRSLLINIADKMREIDEDVWAKYIINKTKDKEYCIIDDLRFQNELNYLNDWIIISLTTPYETRINRIKGIYKEDYKDHIKNMQHKSETDELKLPENTIYINTDVPFIELKKTVLKIINK